MNLAARCLAMSTRLARLHTAGFYVAESRENLRVVVICRDKQVLLSNFVLKVTTSSITAGHHGKAWQAPAEHDTVLGR